MSPSWQTCIDFSSIYTHSIRMEGNILTLEVRNIQCNQTDILKNLVWTTTIVFEYSHSKRKVFSKTSIITLNSIPDCAHFRICLETSFWMINIFIFRLQAHTVFGEAMMTSTNGNIFRVTGPLCGEFTGPLTEASDAELWCFLLSVPG